MRYLFVFRAAPDVDHMTPLAWRLLEGGDDVDAIVTPGFDPAGDHRIELLRGYPAFHLRELRPSGSGPLRRFAGYLAATVPGALWALRRRKIGLVATEWGSGLRAGFDDLGSPRGIATAAGSFARSFARARTDPKAQVRMSFIVAARMLRVPTVCLPHGLSVKLDPPTEEAMRLIGDGSLDWSDRNRFAAYVLNTEHHRQIHLDHGGGDPAVMQTWGSLRWDPAWFDLNRKLVDPIAWPDPDPARLKVLFMVPKWQNRVDAQAAVELFKRIRALPFVSLAVVGHPRGRAESDPLYADAEIDWDGVHDLSGVNSVALIAASDVVVDVGSSIGLEVVMQGKVLVNPEYVHDVATLFDTVPGCCVVAHSADDVARYLSEHAAGRPHVTTATALSELLRHAVYGGREEPFDVIGLYHARVTELARG